MWSSHWIMCIGLGRSQHNEVVRLTFCVRLVRILSEFPDLVTLTTIPATMDFATIMKAELDAKKAKLDAVRSQGKTWMKRSQLRQDELQVRFYLNKNNRACTRCC